MKGTLGLLGLVTAAVIGTTGCTESTPQLHSTTQGIETLNFGFALIGSTGGMGSVVSARSYNSASGGITAQRIGNYYQVTFGSLGGDGGIALVVAQGSDNVRCKIVSVTKSGSDEVIYYLCHEPDGTETDSAAVVQYFRDSGQTGTASAYLYASNESLPFQYCPTSYNSTGGDNCITRTSTGSYDVNLEGLGEDAGSVEVTAVGTDANYCNILSWGPASGSSSDQRVTVKCYDDTGSLADSEFMLGYHGDGDVSYGGLGGDGAYAWADNSTSSSYTPAVDYSYNSPVAACLSAPAISAARVSQGTYSLSFDDKPLEQSSVHVTAYSTTGYCKLSDWDGTSNGNGIYDVEVDVLCFDASGNAADASYVGTYATPFYINPC